MILRRANMKIKWIKTAHKGLRYYEHPDRKQGKKRDCYYAIRFKVDHKEHMYGIGWLSDGAGGNSKRASRYRLKNIASCYCVNIKAISRPVSVRSRRKRKA